MYNKKEEQQTKWCVTKDAGYEITHRCKDNFITYTLITKDKYPEKY